MHKKNLDATVKTFLKLDKSFIGITIFISI